MTFLLTINLDNAVFQPCDDSHLEVAQMLRDIAEEMDERGLPVRSTTRGIMDANGNSVGMHTVVENAADFLMRRQMKGQL